MAAKKSMFNLDNTFSNSKKAFDTLLNTVPSTKPSKKSNRALFNGPGANVLNQYKLRQFGTKKDVDFDGVLNKFDCNPYNTMEQDFSPFRDQSKAEQMSAAKRFGGRNLQGLPKLGSGRDRTVYALDKDKVLKVAKNPGGLTQNTSESDLNWMGLGEEIETGMDYVVAKRNKPLSKEGKQKLAMVRAEVDKVPHRVGEHPSTRLATLKGNLSSEDGALQKAGINDDVLNYDFHPDELFANRQWGEDEEGNLKLNDGGALQSGDSLSKYRVKDFKQDDWQSKEWQNVQNQRRLYKHKGNYNNKPIPHNNTAVPVSTHNALFADNDGDGVLNYNDCVVEDPARQGPWHSPQTLWYAGDNPPSQTVQQTGRVYGFSSKEYADAWKKKHNKKDVYQFTSDKYEMDNKNYSPRKRNIQNDNEFIAASVISEKVVEDTLNFPGNELTPEQRVQLTSYMFLNEANDKEPYTFTVKDRRDGMILIEAKSKKDGSSYQYQIAESEL